MPKFLRFLLLPASALLFSTVAFSIDWPAFQLYQKNGTAAGDNLGLSVASAGDVNGDGKADFIIGAPFADPGGLSDAGSAYVYSGADGSLLYQKNGTNLDNLGISVASAGDMNGDGFSDIIIGAYNADPGGLSSAGLAYVYSGANGLLLYQKNGAAANDFLGISVASAGDVNGDGRADFIIGAPEADPDGIFAAGSAFVYSGADGSLIYQKNGVGANDYLGWSVASAGDVNGDGRSDFIIGAFGADPDGLVDAGSAFVYSGADGSLLYQKNGAAAVDNLGFPVASAGDVNGDDRADFIIGAAGALSYAGSAYVYSGADGSLLFQKNGSTAGDQLGRSLAGAGDVNGDGRADFIIGAPNANPGGLFHAGSVFLYSGADGSLVFQKNGAAANDNLGLVASAGDVNGDGRADFIIASPPADPGGIGEAGTVFVFVLRYVKIASFSDVPNDQGKQVRMSWKALPNGDHDMDLFIVYRRIDGTLLLSSNPPLVQDAAPLPPGNWEQVMVAAATAETSYTTVVPTLVDSTSSGIQYSVFFIRGRSTDPGLYLDSPLDSGYSVDNLVPVAPGALVALGTCQGNQLFCSAPVDEDFQYFKIYRDVSSDFSSPVVVGNTPDSFFVDAAPTGQTFYYRVRAVDFSGNEGNFSPLASALAGLKGDLNNSGTYTASDVVFLLSAAFTGASFPAPFCAADLNCDGRLSASDAVLLLRLTFLEIPVTCTP